jgi:hypothetical protein
MRAGIVRQTDDVTDQVADQHSPAAVDVRDRERAAFAVGQPAPGLRIDDLVKDDFRCGVVPVTVLVALGKPARFRRAVAVENNRLRNAHIAQPLAHVFAHRRRAGFPGYSAHAHAAEIRAHLGGAHDDPPHEARHTPQHGRPVALDQAHRVVERTMHAEVAVRRPRERSHYGRARGVCIGRRA